MYRNSGGFRNFQRGVQATLGECVGHAPPGKFCNFNAHKMDFEASGTYFGSIGTSLANDAAVQ